MTPDELEERTKAGVLALKEANTKAQEDAVALQQRGISPAYESEDNVPVDQGVHSDEQLRDAEGQ